jgi:hypothetical protein
MPAVLRDSNRDEPYGRDLDREVREVESRGRPIEQQPERSGHSNPSDCEAGDEEAGQQPLSLTGTPDEKAAEADLKSSVEGADLGEPSRAGRPPGLLGQGCGGGERGATRKGHEESQEDEYASVE